jgi:hypothetical protein
MVPMHYLINTAFCVAVLLQKCEIPKMKLKLSIVMVLTFVGAYLANLLSEKRNHKFEIMVVTVLRSRAIIQIT